MDKDVLILGGLLAFYAAIFIVLVVASAFPGCEDGYVRVTNETFSGCVPHEFIKEL